ncbi:alpha/beta hydrolase family protein [Undibacterium macrobrachii]|jgi:dipeptidyl aminopeptidase/acylaminoacyl peptidase|uniref:Prolyl oligopeptidase n=1 Tax=Undibacterium macrobrachii TaxID=1119058 RepID=A0ABQ2XE36_9BURK|nr:S9 family peptidase [Undibacterium macrobrachii]GGX11293.1 prolyl oligopeptidase [Undibacterium macrobrachii]
MKRLLLSALILAIPTFANAQTSNKLVPIDAFVEEQKYSMPRLSPDGKHLAVNVRIQRRDRIVPTMTIYALPDLKIVNTFVLPGYEVPIDFGWIKNDRLVIQKGIEVGYRERPEATGEVVAANMDGTEIEYLYGYNGSTQSKRASRYHDDLGYGIISHIPASMDGTIQLTSNEWRVDRTQLYEINTFSVYRKLLADIPMRRLSFVHQSDGKPRFAIGSNQKNETIVLRKDDATGAWNSIDQASLDMHLQPFDFTADDSAFYANFSQDDGPYGLLREDIKTGKRSIIVQDKLSSLGTIEYTSHPSTPFAYTLSVGVPKARYLDESSADAQLHKSLSASFPDAYVHFINFTMDGQKLLFSVSSDRDPGSYYIFDRKTGKADLLLTNMPGINAEQMAERRAIKFKARDGLEITGYLTMPNNPDGNKLPMVLLPHGGPFGVSDTWYFDDEAQFLASRGYAVLQVNFRGSGGRGPKFRRAGYREYGGKMMDDLIDGVKWANNHPEIDKDRVCVFGISFGGYAALMAPIRAPGMFKCAVGYSGRYDLASRLKREDISSDKQATNFVVESMGNDPLVLAQQSPTSQAEKIKIPVFLAHGTKDETTQLDQAEKMRDALIKVGNSPEWMLAKNEGHGFYDSEHRRDFYTRLETFLKKHLSK